MARSIKTWWNHENRELRIPFHDDEGRCVLVVKPGGSVQLDGRYTRFKQVPGGKVVEHVDSISPYLRPDKPVAGEKRKVEEVIGVDDRGYAKTKTVTVSTPEPIDETVTIEDLPVPFNPNRQGVKADQFQG